MVEVRTATAADVPNIVELQHACYPTLSTIALWGPHHLLEHQRVFSDGQLVATTGGHLVGHSASFRVDHEKAFQPHTFREITAAGSFANHDPNGDTLYGAEIMVHPDYRRRGIASRFYRARFELMKRLGLVYFAAGGRIPGYGAVKHRMTPQQYVQEVVEGLRADRVLTPQLRSGLRVRAVLPNYLNDPNSDNYATLLVRAAVSRRVDSPTARATPRARVPKPGQRGRT